MYDIGKFYQAADVEDAVRALVEDPEAVVISGGSDVLIKIREGKLAGCSLVSIHGIKELEGIRMEEDGTIVIGPATTFSHITNNDIIQKHIPMLGDAVDMAGGPQLRNIGTIGGNVCNGVTSADSAPSLMALNAVMELQGPDGKRRVPISEWYAGPGRTVRQHDEVLTAVRIAPENYQGYSGHYIKYGKREAMEISTLGCAVNLKLSADQTTVEDIRIAFGVAAPTPVRCPKTEALVTGRALSAELVKELGESVLTEINPRDSWRASRAFRLQIAREISRRAFLQAVQFAGGDIHA